MVKESPRQKITLEKLKWIYINLIKNYLFDKEKEHVAKWVNSLCIAQFIGNRKIFKNKEVKEFFEN
jgi:hypothetical protein